MRNHLFVVLVVLIFSTSLNQGEKVKVKREASLVAYPRVGRSDLPISNVNFNRHREMEPDTDFQYYNMHDVDLDSASEKDYEDSSNGMSGFNGRMNLKHKVPKDTSMLISDRLRSSKEYRPWQKIDDDRSLYSKSLFLARGARNSQTNGYTPRLGRENELERVFCK